MMEGVIQIHIIHLSSHYKQISGQVLEPVRVVLKQEEF